MHQNISSRRYLSFLMITALLFISLVPVNAFAGIVGTGHVIAEQTSLLDREALIEQINRDDVRAQLEQMGVSADEAVERVASMTDTEVTQLTAGFDATPAGAGVGVVGVVLIVLLVVLLLR